MDNDKGLFEIKVTSEDEVNLYYGDSVFVVAVKDATGSEGEKGNAVTGLIQGHFNDKKLLMILRAFRESVGKEQYTKLVMIDVFDNDDLTTDDMEDNE